MTRPKNKNIRRACKYHALGRARERFGLSQSDVKRVERLIERGIAYADKVRNGNADPQRDTGPLAFRIDRNPNGRDRWRVVYEGRELFVVYDRVRETVVTFLPDLNGPNGGAA